MTKENTVILELDMGHAETIVRALEGYSDVLSAATRIESEAGLPYLRIVADTVRSEKYNVQTGKGKIMAAINARKTERLPVFIEDLAVWVMGRYLTSWGLYESARTDENRAKYSLETLAYQTVWIHIVSPFASLEKREALKEQHEKFARSRELVVHNENK